MLVTIFFRSTVAHITQMEVMRSIFFEMLINDFLNQHRLLGIFSGTSSAADAVYVLITFVWIFKATTWEEISYI